METLGAKIDKLYLLRDARLDLERQAEAMKQQETALQEFLMDNFADEELSGAKGDLASASVTIDYVPMLEDPDAFWDHVCRTHETDLVQQRVSTSGCRERWNARKAVPGVSALMKRKLSLRKIQG
jgi:hypothetical protein